MTNPLATVAVPLAIAGEKITFTKGDYTYRLTFRPALPPVAGYYPPLKGSPSRWVGERFITKDPGILRDEVSLADDKLRAEIVAARARRA